MEYRINIRRYLQRDTCISHITRGHRRFKEVRFENCSRMISQNIKVGKSQKIHQKNESITNIRNSTKNPKLQIYSILII